MKALPVMVLSLALFGPACAYPMHGGRPAPHQARMMMAPVPPPSPVGRWDNVMMLDPGTPILVLRMDGARVEARFHSASPSVLRVDAGETAAEIGAADVVRIDRLPHLGTAARQEAARGAAVGLGTVGVVGLLAGKVPPPRIWAAGAITGGYVGVQSQWLVAGPGTIYLAPVVISATDPPAIRQP